MIAYATHVRFVALVFVALLVWGSAEAGGFYVPQKGPVSIGIGNAGTVSLAADGSTLFFNPAGATQLKHGLVQAGVDGVRPTVKIDDRGSTATTPGTLATPLPYPGSNADSGDWVPVASLYAVKPFLEKKLWVGLAVTAPFGLKLDYANDWFGRYDSINNELKVFNIAPTVAYRINDSFSIGAGVDIQYADAKLTNALPNTLNPGGPTVATDGFAELKGDDWSVGFNVGLMAHPRPGTRIGVHYRSKLDHTLEGTTSISGLQGPLAAGNGVFSTSAGLNLPDIVSVGIAQEVLPGLTLLGEVQWFGWNSFDEIRVKFVNGSPDLVRPQKFQDTKAFSVGAQYTGFEDWELRGGVMFDETPTVDQFRNTSIPDSDLIFLGFGATYKISRWLLFDVGYFHVFFDRANINLNIPAFPNTPAAGLVNVRGRTNNSVDTVSAGFRYWFD